MIKLIICSRHNNTKYCIYSYIGRVRVKRKRAVKLAQNAQIQIILGMRKVSSGPLLAVNTLCSIQ